MSKLTIIGTGLTGLVGSRIVELLGSRYDFVDFSLNTGVDITDVKTLEQAFQKNPDADVVLHLAAFTDLNSAWEQQGDQSGLCYRINVDGTKNIAWLCNAAKKYLIHISTDYVFGGANPPSGGYPEEAVPQPIEWYGETKYLAEKEVTNSGANYAILRIAFPYKITPSVGEAGKVDPPTGKTAYKLDIVRKMIGSLRSGKKLALFQDQIITPTWIDDIARTVDKLISTRPEKEIFHCVGSEPLTPLKMGTLITELFGWPDSLLMPVSLADYQHSHPGQRPYAVNTTLSVEKLAERYQLRPISFTEGIKKYAL